MSRKTNRNPSPGGSNPQPPASAAPPAGATVRRNVFIAAAVVLLLVFAAAALFYKSEKDRSAQYAAAKNQPALVSQGAPAFGSLRAQVHIVEFFDPACGTCATFFPYVKQMLAANPDHIRLSVRYAPFHQGSDQVVRMLEAARSQGKFLPLLEALYASQPRWVVNHAVQADQVWGVLDGLGLDVERLRSEMNSPEISRRLEQDLGDARSLGVTQTPEFFVNGRPLPSFGLEQLQALVSEELSRAYP